MKLTKSIPALMVMGLCLMACGASTSNGVTLGKKIAFLLPESQSARYESKDLPIFKAKILSICSDCTVDYQNAHQDAATQLKQAEAALAGGVNVLVLDPVDASAAAPIVAKARARHVPVIAYDRLVLNSPDVAYYVSFDDSAVGPLQANALLTALHGKTKPTVVMINGDPNSSLSMLLKQGVHSVLDTKVNIVKAYDTPSASADTAQTEMADALTALQGRVDAVYASDDQTAGGVVAALKAAADTAARKAATASPAPSTPAASPSPKAAAARPLPPVTGSGAELPAIQRILTGEQYMTVYEPIRAEAESAAQLAYDLAYGITIPAPMTGGKTVNNSSADIPAVLVSPEAVTRQTIISTVIADGFWTRADICTPQYVEACTAAGLM